MTIKQTKTLLFITIVYFMVISVCESQPLTHDQSLKFKTSIPLPNVKGRIDHLAIDVEHQIVFVVALGNNTVEVVDLKSNKVVNSLHGFSEPQGIIYIPKNNSVFVTNGETGECMVFDAASYKNIATIKLKGDADNVRYDIRADRIYVGYGNGGLAVVDATNFKLISEIALSGHPESFQINKTAKKIFVNVPSTKQIEVVDLSTNRVTNTWKVMKAASNYPMSLDEAGNKLYIGCRQPATLLIINSQTGQTDSSVKIDNDIDDIFYDASRDLIFMSCGEGYIDVIKKNKSNSFTLKDKIPTFSGARTSLLVPELNQFIVASPAGSNKEAALTIYQIK